MQQGLIIIITFVLAILAGLLAAIPASAPATKCWMWLGQAASALVPLIPQIKEGNANASRLLQHLEQPVSARAANMSVLIRPLVFLHAQQTLLLQADYALVLQLSL